MKITEIKLIELRCALAEPVRNSFGQRTERRHLFVEILTDKGISGIGETWTNFPVWAVDERKITLRHLRDIFIGKDPLNRNSIWEEIDRKILKAELIQYGAKGPVYQALSGVDIALWDILGKAYGVPVYQLLGGAVRGSVEAYASGISAGDCKRRVPECLGRGFRAFKVKIGFGEESDGNALRAVRADIGQFKLYADANQKWKNAKEAATQMRALSEFGVGFFEEPVGAAQIEDYRALSEAGIAPVAAGENLYSRREFLHFLNGGLLDVVQPDATKCGGITEAWAVCEDAKLYGVKTALHMFGTAIGLAASLQIMFASSQAHSMEYDVLDNVMMTHLPAKTFYSLENGDFVVAREMPGIGIELDGAFLERYGV